MFPEKMQAWKAETGNTSSHLQVKWLGGNNELPMNLSGLYGGEGKVVAGGGRRRRCSSACLPAALLLLLPGRNK